MIKITIYRHGQTNWNKKKLTQGHTNIPLNLTGLVQAFEIGKKLKDENINLILSSDLSRAYQTARVATKHLDENIPLILSKKLRETCFGKYEGKPCNLFVEECESLISKWNSLDDDSFDTKVEGVETQREVISRFLQCLEDNINRYPESRNILVFSHGGLMKNLYKYLAKKNKFFNNGESLELYYDLADAKLKLIK